MFQRLCLLLTIVSIPAVLGGVAGPAGADHPASSVPVVTSAEWNGLPDIDPINGRFLVVTGRGNFSINGERGGTGMTLVEAVFTAADGQPLEIAVFDGDNLNDWDQRFDVADGIVDNEYDTLYEIYADPTESAILAANLVDGNLLNDPAAPNRQRASETPLKTATDNGNNAWRTIFSSVAGPANAARGSDGRYRFLIRVSLTDLGADTTVNLTGFEMNGFKLAFHNGDYLLPANTTVGFVGGVVDSRFLPGNPQTVHTFDQIPNGVTNTYNGEFEFRFNPRNVCDDLAFDSGDADWNPDINTGQTASIGGTPELSGNPPDHGGTGGIYSTNSTARDARAFKVGGAVAWQFRDPLALTPAYTSAQAPSGHASITESRQGEVIPGVNPLAATIGAPFQRSLIPEATFSSGTGTWVLRWTDLDWRNSVFIRFNQRFGPQEILRSATGRVFCEEDGQPGFNAQVDIPLPNIQLQITPPRGAPFNVTTNAQGIWTANDLAAGTYTISVLNKIPFQPCRENPSRFVVDGCTGARDIDFCYICRGRITGHVFCDEDGNKVYSAPPDLPLPGNPNVTIRLERIVSTAVVETVNVVSVGVNWSADNLRLGTWRIRVAPGQEPTDSLPQTSTQPQSATISFEIPRVDNIDCGYLCDQSLSGRVWCENNGNKTFQLGIDDPLPGVTVTASMTLPVGPVAISTLTAADGTYTIDVTPAGTWTVSIDPLTDAALADTSDLSPTSRSVPVASGQTVTGVDFWRLCLGSLCGRVWVNRGICDERFTRGDEPLAGVTVNLWRLPGGPPALPDATALTGLNGIYLFTDLAPGSYLVAPAGGQPILFNLTAVPPNPRTAPVTAGVKTLDVDFPYCPPARIHGTVFCEQGDCRCLLSRDDQRLEGVVVSIVGTNPVRPPAATLTGPLGQYSFENLQPGEYLVSVDGGQPILVNLTPGSSLDVAVTLAAGDDAEVNFCFCKKGRIFGYVFEDRTCHCDGIFDSENDTPLEGVEVDLALFVGDDALLPIGTDTTDVNGFYEFTNLRAGRYLVSVNGFQPVVVELTPVTPSPVEVILPAGGEERVDFGFCTQRVCGHVFCEPACGCDGIFNDGDFPVPGVIVWLTDVATGAVVRTKTDDHGEYCFEFVKPGDYEITVQDGQAVLAGKKPSSSTVLSTVVKPGSCRFDLDFGYCPPSHQKICVKVFKEGKDCCDGEFTPERDTCLPWIEVFVQRAGDNEGYLASGFTGRDGTYCFEDLAPGDYIVYVGANQEKLKGCRPSTRDCYPVTLEPCKDQWFFFGYCPDCEPRTCCEGDLHEVVVGTAVWVGECTSTFDVCAKLFNGCRNDCQLIDRACAKFRRFPGPVTGDNEVVTILDFKVIRGVAIVVVKITAQGCWFRDGCFGELSRRLVVCVNGRSNEGCAKYRCETLRPGALFTWSSACPPIPSCDGGWEWDGRPWENVTECGSRCSARFLVLKTWSCEDWHGCHGTRSGVIAIH